MIRAEALLALTLLTQDEGIDPSEYRGPAEARAAEVKGAPKPEAPPYLGVVPAEDSAAAGVVLADVADGGPAARAGLEPGDRIVALNGAEVKGIAALIERLRSGAAGQKVAVRIDRGGAAREVEVVLGVRPAAGDLGGLPVWEKPVYRLAVVPFDFPDRPRNPAFRPADFERMLFSRGEYVGRSPSGERAFGSLADYYAENSGGRLTVRGKCFDWVTLEKPRSYFEDRPPGDREAAAELLPKAVSLLRSRDGEDCFDGYDGIAFVYAGRQSYQRMRMLWPNRAAIRAGRRTLPCYLNAEGGRRFAAIGVHVHEFGHLMGLPDQYGRGHATGVGKWCAMGVGHMGGGESRNARPYHLCVWCKERLGWVRPVPIDPRERQRLKLGAIEEDPTQAFKVLLRPDGSEAYYLENRQRRGFDREIEGTGLLIWRLGPSGELELVEAHGRKMPDASLVEPEEIPFPSLYNRHFTPDTEPGSAEGVYLTDIVARDGVVTFRVGERKRVGSRVLEDRAEY